MRKPSLRLQVLGLIAALLAACSSQAPSSSEELHADFVDEIDLPGRIPLEASLRIGDRHAGSALPIVYEWPNQTYDEVDFWAADVGAPLPEPVRWAKGLHLSIPTAAVPVMVEHSFYPYDSTPGDEPASSGFCERACMTTMGDSIGFPIPPVAEAGSMVVQVEWMTPPSRGDQPLVARVTWVVELGG